MSEKLMPCPFCGGTAGDDDLPDSVYCTKCGAETPRYLWNTRTPAPEARAAAIEEPYPVLTYANLLVADDSPLFDDKEWMESALKSVDEEGNPLLRLALNKEITGMDAVNYVQNRRRYSAPASSPDGVRAAALEEAARVCDDTRGEWHKNMMACKPGSARAKKWAELIDGAHGLANSIRALRSADEVAK